MLNFLLLEEMPIFEQLKLEEALLRGDDRDWCLINFGSPSAIVMGLSTPPEKVIDQEVFKKNPLPLMRRYSGGGTVIIEPTTLFVSWILNHTSLPVAPFPREVMRWSEKWVQQFFSPLPVRLKEHDYAIGDQKFGGNAQYFVKNRLVHHTSFLWDYSPSHMEYLLLPPKMPAYRKERSHESFLCTLRPHFPLIEELVKAMAHSLEREFSCHKATLEEAFSIQKFPHRLSTHLVDWN